MKDRRILVVYLDLGPPTAVLKANILQLASELWVLLVEKLRRTNLDFVHKEIKWTIEFVRRVIERGIINIFNFDLDLCKIEIESLMKTKGVVVHSPDEKRLNQKWCLIELPELGLAKIPVIETPTKIRVITIANPVNDPRCKEAYYGKV